MNPIKAKLLLLLNGVLLAIFMQNALGNEPLHWDPNPVTKRPKIFWTDEKDTYLIKLREDYMLDSIVADSKSDIEKVLRVTNWVNSRWEHYNNNQPEPNDPIAILEKAKWGHRFSCYEYATVLSASLTSLGLKSRIVNLFPKDVETRQIGPVHVVAEVYLKDNKKWAMADAQFNLVPFADDKPLNVIDFKNTLEKNADKIELRSLKTVNKIGYLRFISPYLYYVHILFDNRIDPGFTAKLVYGGIMLVPIGARNPVKFRNTSFSDKTVYTNSLRMIYFTP